MRRFDGQIRTLADLIRRVEDIWSTLSTRLTMVGRWTDFVPVLETSATQPVLGDGIAEARWVQIGDLVHVQGQLRYGSVGETIGTGNYFIKFGGITSGPPDAQTTMGHVAGDGLPVGLGKGNDNDAGTSWMFHLEMDTAIRVGITRGGTGDQSVRVTTASPFAFAENDRIRFSFWYQAA